MRLLGALLQSPFFPPLAPSRASLLYTRMRLHLLAGKRVMRHPLDDLHLFTDRIWAPMRGRGEVSRENKGYDKGVTRISAKAVLLRVGAAED